MVLSFKSILKVITLHISLVRASEGSTEHLWGEANLFIIIVEPLQHVLFEIFWKCPLLLVPKSFKMDLSTRHFSMPLWGCPNNIQSHPSRLLWPLSGSQGPFAPRDPSKKQVLWYSPQTPENSSIREADKYNHIGNKGKKCILRKLCHFHFL